MLRMAPTNPNCISDASDVQSKEILRSPISGTPPEIFPPEREAMDKGRTFNRAWARVQESQSRLKHMKSLKNEGIGFNMDEHFLRRSNQHRRAEVTQGELQKKVIKITMEMRVKDENSNLKALKREKN